MFIRKRERKDNYYQVLQERTLERLQELSGEVWTDYNIHDPGVTIADNMNYALFELHYKLELPFESFIGKGKLAEKGIFGPERIFTPSIVTPEDYEQLFVSEISDLESCQVEFADGYYRVHAYVSLLESGIENEHIKEEIYVRFHEHRNLCEDLKWEHIFIHAKTHGKRRKKYAPSTNVEWNESHTQSTDTAPDVNPYHSFQLDFPDAYGIGLRGLPPQAETTNSAHVLQLKGYLAIMDFMLAHYTRQVRETPDLIDLSQQQPSGEVSLIDIPDINQIVDQKRFDNTHQLEEDQTIHQRRQGYLDLLDTLYGEDTGEFWKKYLPAEDPVSYRTMLTRELPDMNRNRFLSFNKLDPSDSSPTFKNLFSIIQGKEASPEIPVQEYLRRRSLDLIPDNVFFEQYEVYLNLGPISGVFYTPIFNEKPQEVPFRRTEWEDEYLETLQMEINLLRRNALFEGFLLVGSNPANYRMVELSESNTWMLLFRFPGKKEWMVMGVYQTAERLVRSANCFWAFIRFLNPERQLFFLVEHRLLDHAYPEEAHAEDGNTISIVVSNRVEHQASGRYLEELIRERLPAHLRVRLFPVMPEYIYDFEHIYHKWRQALSGGNKREIIHFSESIRAFFRVSHEFARPIL